MTFEDWLESTYSEYGGAEEFFNVLLYETNVTSDDIICWMNSAWDARYDTLTYMDI